MLLPRQTAGGVLTPATTKGVTVMVWLSVLEQPPLVTVTEYVVVVAGDTLTPGVVGPWLHAYVPPPPAVIVATSPAQIVTPGVIVGDTEFTVTFVVTTSVQP